MSTFRYSKEELERNKVLKYNLDLSRQLQNDPALARTRSETLLFPYVAKHFGYRERFDPSQRLPHDDKSIENAHRAANDDFRDKNLNKHPTG